MEKQKNVPALRFPEFTGEWEKKNLGEVAEIGRGKSKHRPRDEAFLYGGKYPFIQTGDIRNAGLYLDTYSQTYSEAGLKQSKLWDEDTLCITIAANIAETAILRIKACFPDSIIGLIPKDNLTTVLFVKYQFDKFKIDIQKLSQGVAQANLNQERLSAIEFYYPTLPEQTKIANFLTAIDTKIQQLTQKKTLLEEYKKGVMQQLFSQKIRFKDENGEDYPDWEETKLGEVGKFVGGGTPSTQNKEFWQGDIPWISSSDLIEDSIHKIAITRFITKEAVNNSPVKLIPPNSILIVSRVGVGKVAINGTALCTSQDFANLIPSTSEYYSLFLAYLIKFQTIKLLGFNQGTSIKGFVKSDLENLEISIPCYNEQLKIGDYFFALDKKIELISKQITQTQTYKKGLLQQLFI